MLHPEDSPDMTNPDPTIQVVGNDLKEGGEPRKA